jgi:hypothetical protein
MKTINKIIATVIIIFCNLFCYSQYQLSDSQKVLMQQHELKVSLSSIQKAPYIFEGTVTHQENYYNKNGEMLTCTVISITKIFKGNPQIKLGSIKVITDQGGTIEGHTEKSLDDGSGLSKNGTYIIFGKTTGTANINDKMITTDNLLTLDCIDHIDFIRGGASWGWHNPTNYKTLDDLYAFLKENGLSVQEEIEQQQTTPADSTKQK